ncbi:hypothetical protein IMSAGC004_01897 [Bacteroidaceae bacterium]|nr:hypothetical protein IMSAGC004_01897 [Bacteroidaceae bacterium]
MIYGDCLFLSNIIFNKQIQLYSCLCHKKDVSLSYKKR